MRIKLLIVLLLNSVSGVSSDVHGCLRGWFELRCRYPQTKSTKQNQNLDVSVPRGRSLRGDNIGENKWGTVYNQRSLYHNTTGKYWRVLVKQLTKDDLDDYVCRNGPTGKIDLDDENPVPCPESSQISDSGGNTSINCTHPRVNFICKENSPSCDILVRGPRPIYSIRNVTLQHQGIYWCGYEPQNEDYKVSRQKIHLQVVEVTKRRLSPGQDLIHSCNYTSTKLASKKFVCKGESTTVCPEIVSTSNLLNERFSLEDVRKNWTVILTIQSVTMEDSGFYWCGTTINREYQFYHKLELTVAPMPLTTRPSHPDMSESSSPYTKNASYPDYSTSPTPTQSLYDQDERQRTLIITAMVLGVILLLVLIAFCIHKIRGSFTNPTPANKEEHCYEEIQERPRQIASGTALKTIYAIASAPQPASSGNGNTGNMRKTTDETFKDNVLYSSSVAQ